MDLSRHRLEGVRRLVQVSMELAADLLLHRSRLGGGDVFYSLQIREVHGPVRGNHGVLVEPHIVVTEPAVEPCGRVMAETSRVQRQCGERRACEVLEEADARINGRDAEQFERPRGVDPECDWTVEVEADV